MFTSDWIKPFHFGIFPSLKTLKNHQKNFCKLEKDQKHGLNVLQAEKTKNTGIQFLLQTF